MSNKIKDLLCKFNFHLWNYTTGRYSRECINCNKHQITIGENGTSLYDKFITNFKGKFE